MFVSLCALQKDELGVDPTPQATFERCYKKRDGTWSDPLGVGPQVVVSWD